MVLSVDFQGLRQLREYPDRELPVTRRLEQALQQMYQQALSSGVGDPILIQRQLQFVKEERQRIRQRASLLAEAEETISDANLTFGEKLTESKYWLQQTD